jgi:predicted outer membrane repeat protein
MSPKAILVAAVMFCMLAVALLWRVPEADAALMTITVDTTTDSNAAGYQVCSGAANDCSLRGAISKANSDPGNFYTIIVPSGTYTLTLTGAGESGNAIGDLDIATSLTINGAGATSTIIQGGPGWDDRIIDFVTGGHNVLIHGVTIQNGNLISNTLGGGINIIVGNVVTITNSIIKNNTGAAQGGGIYHFGASLTLAFTTVSNNSVTLNGGGVYAAGALTLDHARILSNTAYSSGGLDQEVNSTAVITESVIAGNQATGGDLGTSGGIFNAGVMTMSNTTISGNRATSFAGGLGNAGVMTITNSTISGNRSNDSGGGVRVYTTVTTPTLNLINVTIANNTSDDDNNGSGYGGGLAIDSGTVKNVNVMNTIIGANIDKTGTAPDCYSTINGGGVTSQGYNLIQSGYYCTISGTLTGVITNTNPLLGPLANVGGSTPVHTLLAGSPAINAGNPAASDGVGAHCMPTDQRGETRPIDGRCDIGSFEGTGAALYLPLIIK